MDLQLKLQCWGHNKKKQRVVPREVLWDIYEISLGENHTCAVNNQHYGECWGHNKAGQADIPRAVK